jgi:hypothetical protein
MRVAYRTKSRTHAAHQGVDNRKLVDRFLPEQLYGLLLALADLVENCS